MSHFATVAVRINDRDLLVAGLNAMFQFHGLNIPVHVFDEKQELANTYDPSAETKFAHVILRRQNLFKPVRRRENVFLDIGFEQTDDGSFRLHGDDWDIPHTILADVIKPYQHSWLAALERAVQPFYVREKVLRSQPQLVQTSDLTLFPDGRMQWKATTASDLCQPVSVGMV